MALLCGRVHNDHEESSFLCTCSCFMFYKLGRTVARGANFKRR